MILVGPKHTGKTSAGLALAALLAAEFIDLDALIESRTGKSPRTLYTEGPERFQEAETQALESIIRPRPRRRRVVAAGGGLIDNPGAMALLKGPGGPLLIYLELSSETAWERILLSARTGGGLPPFLDTGSPRDTHRRLHERRSAAYKDCAHISIAAEGKTAGAIGEEIVSRLEQRGEWPGKPSRK
jgi:shikimate kinase